MTTQITYKFRAECSHDSLLIRSLIHPWMIDWHEVGAILVSGDGRQMRVPDVDVTFTLNHTAPTLAELRWLFSQFIDLHVAVESIELAPNYTGLRNTQCEVLQTPKIYNMVQIIKTLPMPCPTWVLYQHTCLRLSSV